MKQLDYIVVGLGIAGISFCEQLRLAGKSFVAVDDDGPTATSVAAGTINPVVLKHFTPVWQGALFLEAAHKFYKGLESHLSLKLINDRNMARVMASEAEGTTWVKAAGKEALKAFLEPQIQDYAGTAMDVPYGMGTVLQSFRLDPAALRSGYLDWLEKEDALLKEAFDYSKLEKIDGKWTYGDLQANKLVFAEGVGATNNPHFTIDTLILKKGAYMIVEAPELKLDRPLKARFFVIPLGEDRYKVGATFVHGDHSYQPTEQSRKQVSEALDKLLKVPYRIVDHVVGMRPTVKDRRPLLGSLGETDLYFYNGLGTRGLLMAPTLSKWIFDHIENGTPIPEEADINRYALP